MYLRSSFHHRSKLAPFFLFYRKLIGEIECIRDLFLLVFESSGLCLSAFIKLKILFKWFKNWEQVCNGVRYRRYGCCPHWEFIIVHVDACHLNLNCQPQIGPLLLFYWFFFNNRSRSIWFTLIIFVIFLLFYPFRLSCSSTAHKEIIYIHGLDTGETLDNTIYFATWNRGSRPRPVTWEKAVNRRMGKHFDFHVSKRLFIDFIFLRLLLLVKRWINDRRLLVSCSCSVGSKVNCGSESKLTIGTGTIGIDVYSFDFTAGIVEE